MVERSQDGEVINRFGWNFLFHFKLLALKSYDFFLDFARDSAIERIAFERCFINAERVIRGNLEPFGHARHGLFLVDAKPEQRSQRGAEKTSNQIRFFLKHS